MSTIQMMGASTKGRGMAAANCNRDKFASFFAVADKNKKKKTNQHKKMGQNRWYSGVVTVRYSGELGVF